MAFPLFTLLLMRRYSLIYYVIIAIISPHFTFESFDDDENFWRLFDDQFYYKSLHQQLTTRGIKRYGKVPHNMLIFDAGSIKG